MILLKVFLLVLALIVLPWLLILGSGYVVYHHANFGWPMLVPALTVLAAYLFGNWLFYREVIPIRRPVYEFHFGE